MAPIHVSYDLTAEATYVRFSEEPVARTVEINDALMVDIDFAGEPVGVEFLVLPAGIPELLRDGVLFARFPQAKTLL